MYAHTATLLSLLSLACAQIHLDLKQQIVNASALAVASDSPSNLQRRANALTTEATNRFNSYTVEVSIGDPAKTYNLLIDTGSASTWVKNLTLTKSSIDTKKNSSVAYGIGGAEGEQYLDTLRVAGGAVYNQSLMSATSQTGYDDVDGVLAFGPVDLTQFTVGDTNLVPTVMDNLAAQKVIPANLLGIAFVPATSVSDVDAISAGRITLGGTDNTSYVGEITYMNVTEQYPSNMYWGLDCSDMVYQDAHGVKTHLASEPALRSGIIDSGTTLIQIPSDAFRRYVAQLPGAVINDAGFLAIPDTTVPNMGNFTFVFSGNSFTLSPSAQLFPPEIAAQFGQTQTDYSYSVFGSSGTRTTGLDFTLGMMFLERFYSVYDADNNRIGLAETPYTHQHTSERASYRKAKRAHNARVHARAAAQQQLTLRANATSTETDVKVEAGKKKRGGKKNSLQGGAEGKKRRLGVLRALDPFEATTESS